MIGGDSARLRGQVTTALYWSAAANYYDTAGAGARG